MQNKEAVIFEISKILTKQYSEEELFQGRSCMCMPNSSDIIDIVKALRAVIFPGYFEEDSSAGSLPEYYVGYRLNNIYDMLKKQIEVAFIYDSGECNAKNAGEIAERFLKKIPAIQEILLKDLQAGFDGDPAANSKEEIIYSYPGFYAIYVYRLAHELYLEKVPFIPRIMTEHAHGATGIDINPGASIGEYFFIDHGTGVVIGETTTIGNNVKLYQGVTLGALSTRKGQALSGLKRHPTICDNVTIYSNSTVLGGETVIGKNTIIGGNTFITSSIPEDTKVNAKSPELEMKNPNLEKVWYWEI